MATIQDNTGFDELNDEIGADDWLIPRNELTKRRLIKQTPRYNIYKADWFGDVLVYEPTEQETIRRFKRQQTLASRRKIVQPNQHQHLKTTNQYQLDTHFNELAVEIHTPKSWQRNSTNNYYYPIDSSLPSPTFSCNSIQIDSGYSSPSSTPQYSTKHANEFEFPSLSSASPPTTTYSSLSRLESPTELLSSEPTIIKARKPIETSSLENSRQMIIQGRMCSVNVRRPVVLNRDSFEFCGHDEQLSVAESENGSNNYSDSVNIVEPNYDNNREATGANNGTEMVWFELNELRLVAHEGFMLFMGASMDLSQVQCDQYASLVMQMSHPRAVSLFNLLHANNYAQTSPVDRFFASSANKASRPLELADKFNICQQVTNAMTYLHDKNIVHGRLTSVNIYIEPNQRVKISLIDNEEQPIASANAATGAVSSTKGIINQSPTTSTTSATRATDTTTTTTTSNSNTTTTTTTTTTGHANSNRHPNAGSISFSLPALTYLSPELIKTIRICQRDNNICDNNQTEARVQMDTSQLTKKADIFSFGTLLFELFEERFPYGERTNDAGNTFNHDPFHAYLSQSLLATPSPSPMKSPLVKNTQQTNWNGNIHTTASELIFQIGTGQMDHMNQDRSRSPALVDYIISSCWSLRPEMRPNFKQLASAFRH